MDYSNWLKTLSLRINKWRSINSQRFKLLSSEIQPIRSSTNSNSSFAIPPELASFYDNAANGCDISFLIYRPSGFRIPHREKVIVPPTAHCGFGIVSDYDLPNVKMHLDKLLDTVKRYNTLPSRVTSFFEHAFPFWLTQGGDYLAIVSRNSKFESGVYYIAQELITEDCFAFKYADSFEEWLIFLEDNLYYGPDWSQMCALHNGHKLIANQELMRTMTEMIEGSNEL